MKRERYNTTLKPESRRQLRILTALHGFRNENEMIEYMIENWGRSKNEMGNENYRQQSLNDSSK